MKVHFLGTGTSSGVPMVACDCEVCQSSDPYDKRLRSSVWIEAEGFSFTIDIGPDFRQQMLREGVKHLDAVVMTHGHKDHTGGLDDIRAYNFKQGVDMPIYADKITCKLLKSQYEYIFEPNPYPGIPKIKLMEIENAPFKLQGLEIIPISVMHHRLPVFGFRIKDFTYITDANHIRPEEVDKVRGSKVLVLNALRKKQHISHFTLDEALELIDELKPEKAYLTHISHQLGKHADISKELPPHVYLAYDGLTLELD